MSDAVESLMLRDVHYLSGPDTAGRLSGTVGAKKAATYLTDQLKKMGFQPYGSSFFEPIEVKAARLEAPARLTIGDRVFVHRQDFSEITRYSGSGNVQGELFIIKDGDEVNEQELRGKVVLIHQRPDGFDLKGTIQTALDFGVKGLLIEWGDPTFYPKTLFGTDHGKIPVLRIKKALISHLEKMNEKMVNIDLPLKVEVKECQNVIGVLPGSSSEHTVVLSAHYDHLGDDPEGFRFPGVIDNVSGVVTMLEVARKLAQRTEPLPFTLIIAFFSGEESGMIGAKHFLDHVKIPISVAINIDCLGQEEQLALMRIGYDAPDHWFPSLAAEIFKQEGVEIVWKAFNGDDSVAFRNRGIPVLGLGQKSVEKGLKIHTPEDNIDRLHLSPVKKAAEIITEIVEELFKGGENDELH